MSSNDMFKCFNVSTINFVLYLYCLQDLSLADKKRKAKKLHLQFSHAPANRLKKLLEDSGCGDRELHYWCVENCCKECELCLKYRKAPLKPVVGLPLATKFNEVVCMDLKEIEHRKTWILHLIDAATRYSAGCLIRTKRKEVVVGYIFRMWIAYFGSPRKFFSDNGSQLTAASKELKEVIKNIDWNTLLSFGHKYGTTWSFSPADAPWYNGATESLIKSVKRALNASIGDHVLTRNELQTVMFEAA